MKLETNKRCSQCQNSMKPLFGGAAYKCKCGNAYLHGKGFVQLKPGEDIFITDCLVHGDYFFYPEIRFAGEADSGKPEKRNIFVRQNEPIEAKEPYKRDAYSLVRGGIYFVHLPSNFDDHRSQKSRPCIIVGNVEQMEYSSHVTVIPLTTNRNKEKMKSHVPVASAGKAAVALVEQITCVDTRQVGDFMGMASVAEMIDIKKAMHRYLSCDDYTSTEQERIENLTADVYALRAQIQELTNENRKLREGKK